jgi:hydrogenase maturation protease
MRRSKLLVGVGNVLKCDDGVGVRAAERMANLGLSPEIEVCDAGTVGLEAAQLLEGRKRVVVVDAIDVGAPPGTVFRLAPEQLRPYVNSAVSLHDLHLLDALNETRLVGTAPEEVVVLAVQGGDWSTGIGLSPAVEAALDKIVRSACELLDVPQEPLRSTANTETVWS